MSQQIDKIYKEYFDKFVSLIDSDSFYQYVLENIGAGHNKISFYHKKKDKKIDEKWIEAIEDCIIELDTIIRNPRRFIVQEDEIVPIEKARRITNESIRHLAQHTNMIAQVKGDDVTPNEILNVYREESFDIYENRFIYTLLNKLIVFVEQRRDVLFSITDDEEIIQYEMSGQFNNGGEDVEFDFKMSTSEKQSYLEMDTKHMNVFARIDRLHRILQEFMGTPFARTMRGSAPVRPPIMRTNVILKDPNFKKCLVLWGFIETYNDVGYTIDFINEYKELDQDSVLAYYNTMALAYICLKKDSDTSEDVDVEHKKKRRQLKPKFVKNIVEEIVADYDITEVEIKKVFVDEINRATKKKAEAEAAIVEAIKTALAAEKEAKLEEARRRKEEIARLKEIERKKIEREKKKIAAAAAKEKARIEREKKAEKARIAKEEAEEKARLAKEAAKEKARLKKEKEAEKLKEQKQKEKAKAKAQKEKAKQLELEKEKAAKAKEKAKAKREKEKAIEAEKAAVARAKEREKAKADKEKLRAAEAEKARKLKEKEKARKAKEKAQLAEKEKAAKAKEKERQRKAKEKEKAQERIKAAKEKEKAKAKAAKEKAAAKAKQKKDTQE